MTALTPRQRFRMRLVAVFLALMVGGYARQFITSPTAAQDFRVFFAAASVVAHGEDPYDWATLARTENTLYNAPHHLRPGARDYYEFLAFPEGPWLAFGLVPLTGLPWQAAFAFFGALLGLVIAAAAWTVFRMVRWSPRPSRLAAAAVLLSPIGFINLFMGQVGGLLLGAFALSWLLVRRWPIVAGLALTPLWIKPNIGLELPLVMALLEPRAALRMLGGFCLGTVAAFSGALALMGSAFFQWPAQVPRMWAAVQGPQPDIASLESFYYPGLSGGVRTVALVATLAIAATYGVWLVRRAPDSRARALGVLLIWMAFLPFVQGYDMILLLPVLAVLLGPTLAGWTEPVVEASVWAFLLFPLGFFLGLRIGFFNGFTAVPVAFLVLAWHRHLTQGTNPALERAAA